MQHGLTAQLLIAFSLSTIMPLANAKQETLSQQPGDKMVQTVPQSGSEVKLASMASDTRGQLLYENHCRRCHTSVVHVRANHKVHSMEDLQNTVTHWASELKLPWSAEEINDVVKYLDQRFYDLK